MFKSNKAITMITLIIIIIVLLILAGVTINMVLGDNGIINKSKASVGQYKNAADIEELGLENYNTEILKYISNTRQETNNDSEYITNIDFQTANYADKVIITITPTITDNSKLLGYHCFAIKKDDPNDIHANITKTNQCKIMGLTKNTDYYIIVRGYDIKDAFATSEIKTINTGTEGLIASSGVTLSNSSNLKQEADGTKYVAFNGSTDKVTLPNLPASIDFASGYEIEITATYTTTKNYQWIYYLGDIAYYPRTNAIGLLQSTVNSPAYAVNIINENDSNSKICKFSKNPNTNVKHNYRVKVEKNASPTTNNYYTERVYMDEELVGTMSLPQNAVVNTLRRNNAIGWNDGNSYTLQGKVYYFRISTVSDGLILNYEP